MHEQLEITRSIVASKIGTKKFKLLKQHFLNFRKKFSLIFLNEKHNFLYIKKASAASFYNKPK